MQAPPIDRVPTEPPPAQERIGTRASDVARVIVVTLAAAAVWFRLWEPFPHASVIGIAATLIGGWPIFAEAFENAIRRRMTMELSMTIALVAALAIGEFFTALVITAFVLGAEILETLTVSRGRRAIGALLDLLPQTATVRRAGQSLDVAATDLRVDDLVLVDPGGLVPVDGTVVAGRSFVDEARITGESMPVEKVAGCAAFAGTLNAGGALEIRAERIGADTSFGKIVEAVESAERSRAPIQKLADRLSGYLVYFALGAAVLTYLLTRDGRATISVVIVAGACGVAAGTPLAILGAIGRAAREGAIVKGGRYLEVLAAVDTVAFDKTGTLTLGEPVVIDVIAAPGVSAHEVMSVASIAERRSEHPLGKAVVAHAAELGLPALEPDEFVATPGRGIEASFAGSSILTGNRELFAEQRISFEAPPANAATEILVARDGLYLGRIAVADALRGEAREAVAALKALGIRTILLTGDALPIARRVAGELGIGDFAASLLPEGKRDRIAALVRDGRTVAMVGDGINDAPALATAQVGVAMGSGTDVARESADVVLLGNDLARFVETIRIARRTKAIVMQNFAGTIAVDAIGIALAAAGVLHPLAAAFIHVASELTFILNATRMLPGPAGDARSATLRHAGTRSKLELTCSPP